MSSDSVRCARKLQDQHPVARKLARRWNPQVGIGVRSILATAPTTSPPGSAR